MDHIRVEVDDDNVVMSLVGDYVDCHLLPSQAWNTMWNEWLDLGRDLSPPSWPAWNAVWNEWLDLGRDLPPPSWPACNAVWNEWLDLGRDLPPPSWPACNAVWNEWLELARDLPPPSWPACNAVWNEWLELACDLSPPSWPAWNAMWNEWLDLGRDLSPPSWPAWNTMWNEWLDLACDLSPPSWPACNAVWNEWLDLACDWSPPSWPAWINCSILDLSRVGTMSRSPNSRSRSASCSSSRMPQYDWISGGTADLCFGHPCLMNRLKHCITGSPTMTCLNSSSLSAVAGSFSTRLCTSTSMSSGAPQLGSPRMNARDSHIHQFPWHVL